MDRHCAGILQICQYSQKVINLLRLVLIALEVFLELACVFENPHKLLVRGRL